MNGRRWREWLLRAMLQHCGHQYWLTLVSCLSAVRQMYPFSHALQGDIS